VSPACIGDGATVSPPEVLPSRVHVYRLFDGFGSDSHAVALPVIESERLVAKMSYDWPGASSTV
jgi:hypothetical protein